MTKQMKPNARAFWAAQIRAVLGEFLQGVGLGIGILAGFFVGGIGIVVSKATEPSQLTAMIKGAAWAGVWIAACVLFAVGGRYLRRGHAMKGLDSFAWNLFSVVLVCIGVALGALLFIAWMLFQLTNSTSSF
jgi:hypothetical protein